MNIKQLLIATILLLSSAAYGQPDFEETKLLAEQGNANAQTILGVMYDNGEGVPENMSSDEKGELIIISELSISELRREIIAVEDEFFRVFNENNDDDSLDVHCRKERMVYSLIPRRICQPNFEVYGLARYAFDFLPDPPDSAARLNARPSDRFYGRNLGKSAKHEQIINAMMEMTNEIPNFAELNDILTGLRTGLNQLTAK
tara:strand:+ start:144 stop:749 length:606 start_codon:yes stop_codon:yes gene_type:complete